LLDISLRSTTCENRKKGKNEIVKQTKAKRVVSEWKMKEKNTAEKRHGRRKRIEVEERIEEEDEEEKHGRETAWYEEKDRRGRRNRGGK
jgi:hypothetical protein